MSDEIVYNSPQPFNVKSEDSSGMVYETEVLAISTSKAIEKVQDVRKACVRHWV